ncbi:MAG: hypothetical protein P4L44_16550 [Oryzomonas sp.]|uniref:hypothetical protein n=1 Tax=Oryzomonas sp. TaxID=2855186 RepID=UPI00283D30D2|nr:hypothetical protein [Oryzomonas sp.]MDR3581573.1 hypothetical protein [Oryzomonas sp.]
MNAEFCAIVGQVADYLERHPEDGAERLRAFLEDGRNGLWDTDDVLKFTGWGRTTVSKLVNTGKIPYIPGNPNKFIPAAVKAALENMQIGGTYGRRKSKTRRYTP